jgi:hypothetical protein
MPFPASVSPAASGGPARHGSASGFLPPQESRAPRAVINAARHRWLPWVFRLSRNVHANLGPDFADPPPTRFARPRTSTRRPPHLGVSISSRSARPPTRAGWAGNRHRPSAPGRTEHSIARRPGYFIHLPPRPALPPTANGLRAFVAIYRSCSVRPEVLGVSATSSSRAT